MTEAERLQSEVARLSAALKRANDQAEHFEREWYLLGDELEALKKAISEAQPVAIKWRGRDGGPWRFCDAVGNWPLDPDVFTQTEAVPLYTLKGIK